MLGRIILRNVHQRIKMRSYHKHIESHKEVLNLYKHYLCELSTWNYEDMELSDCDQMEVASKLVHMHLVGSIYHKKSYELLKKVDNDETITEDELDWNIPMFIDQFKNIDGYKHDTVYEKLDEILKHHDIEKEDL